MSYRGVRGLVLTLFLPPVGLFYLWKRGIFQLRGRILISALATVEMLLICLCFLPKTDARQKALPVASVPVAVTVAPESDTLNALSNIEQLLYEQQVDLGLLTETEDTTSTIITAEEQTAGNEEVLNTIVYSVFNGAKYYHASSKCNGQTNGRELTVREAMQEGLGACKNCNPPVLTN